MRLFLNELQIRYTRMIDIMNNRCIHQCELRPWICRNLIQFIVLIDDRVIAMLQQFMHALAYMTRMLKVMKRIITVHLANDFHVILQLLLDFQIQHDILRIAMVLIRTIGNFDRLLNFLQDLSRAQIQRFEGFATGIVIAGCQQFLIGAQGHQFLQGLFHDGNVPINQELDLLILDDDVTEGDASQQFESCPLFIGGLCGWILLRSLVATTTGIAVGSIRVVVAITVIVHEIQ
mmetsp:Transcript_20612/g.58608  ORF Transcript_20612/g.58608 Transcript_20612/m.58608 type:complete len:233 (+) Transcript_20612:2080-2778(+)